MGYPQYPYPYQSPYPHPYPPPSARNASDVAISVTVMVLTVLLGGSGAIMGVSMLAFLDHCPPTTCSPEGAVTAVLGALGMAAVIAVVGMILTVVRLTMRKRSWPLAVGTLLAVAAVFAVGVIGYSAAVS